MPNHQHKRARQAGMVCNEGAFHKFLGVPDKEAAAARLRRLCQIGSRRELDTDPAAATIFEDLVSRYEAWLRE